MGGRGAKWDPRRGCIARVEKTLLGLGGRQKRQWHFASSGTQENERAQRGTWQVGEVHRMSVLTSVPEIRSSGGWGGIRMEVPAQHSGTVAPPRLEE